MYDDPLRELKELAAIKAYLAELKRREEHFAELKRRGEHSGGGEQPSEDDPIAYFPEEQFDICGVNLFGLSVSDYMVVGGGIMFFVLGWSLWLWYFQLRGVYELVKVQFFHRYLGALGRRYLALGLFVGLGLLILFGLVGYWS